MVQGRDQVGEGGVVTGGRTGALHLIVLVITGLVTIGYLILNKEYLHFATRRFTQKISSYLDFLTQRRELSLVNGIEGGVINFVLGSGMFECEQVDKSVTPQHLIWKIRGTRLKYENSFLLSSRRHLIY